MPVVMPIFPRWERISRSCGGISHKDRVNVTTVCVLEKYISSMSLFYIEYIFCSCFDLRAVKFPQLGDKSADEKINHRKCDDYEHHHLFFLYIIIKKEVTGTGGLHD